MKKEIFKQQYKASTKEYLVALALCPQFTRLLNPDNKPFQQVHEWLLKNEISLADENRKLPSIKEIALELKTDSTKISKQIKLIYQEIHLINEEYPESFKKEGQKLCFLSFNYLDSYTHFNIGLDIIPRIGEVFHFCFIKPINGGTNFYVNDVVYFCDKGFPETWVYLSHEYPNAYLQILKEKAYLHRDISFPELLSNSNFSFEEELVKHYKTL
jgi:hypothetical protein